LRGVDQIEWKKDELKGEDIARMSDMIILKLGRMWLLNTI
jgi:hypothetical protein